MSDINQENPNLTDPDGENSPTEGKKQFSDKQLRIFQVIAGIISAIALVASMFIPNEMIRQKTLPADSPLNYLFVVVFLAVMFGRRTVENKYRLRLGLYSLVLIDGILAGILLYVINMLNVPESPYSTLNDTYKVLIIIGGVLVILVLGVLIPYLRFRKRVAEDKQPPIRIPEKKQEAATADGSAPVDDGPMSIEQRVAAMMAEVDAPKSDDAQNSEDSSDK